MSQPSEDDFARACRRQQRVVAILQSYEGECLTTAQICEGLCIEERSPEHESLVWMLAKLEEYKKVSHDRKAGESVWWVEPKRAQEPAFNLRHVKAVVSSRDRQ